MSKKNKKGVTSFLIFILLTNVLSFIYPLKVFSETDKIELSPNETNIIIGSLYQEIFDEWVSFTIESGDPKKEAVLAILKKTIKNSTLNYLFVQAPKEIALDFIKIGKKVAPIISEPDLSSLAKLGAEELKKIIIEELVKNEIRIGGGNLSVSYLSMSGEVRNETFSYILAYNPKNGKSEINIYSLNNIKTPRPTLSNPWLGGVDNLPPFVVNISGVIRKISSGYSWKSLNVDISFPNNIPRFEFKELSFLEKQLSPDSKTLAAFKRVVEIMGGAEEKAVNIWNRLKGAISSAADKGMASIYSIIRGPEGDEALVLVGKDDGSSPEKSKYWDDASNSGQSKTNDDEEIQRLLRIIADLEKQTGKTSGTQSQNSQTSSRVEINTASKENLMRIVHVGSVRADEIIRLRPFSSLDDLLRVSGIGSKVLADIKAQGLAYVEGEFINNFENEKTEKDEKTQKEEKEIEKDGTCGKPVNINTATLKELTCLTGIGEVIAQRIIDYRKNNPFQTLDDLLNVTGIGPKVLANIKTQGLAYVEGGSAANNPPFSNNPPSSSGKPNNKNEIEICLPKSINLNTATKEELMLIYGIGEAKAQNIMEYREQNIFYFLDDLLNVTGIGPSTLEKIKNQGCAFVDINFPPVDDENENDEGDENGNNGDDDLPENEEIIILGAEAVLLLKISYPNDLAFKKIAIPQELNNIFVSQGGSFWELKDEMSLPDEIMTDLLIDDDNVFEKIELIKTEPVQQNTFSSFTMEPYLKSLFGEIFILSSENFRGKELLKSFISDYG